MAFALAFLFPTMPSSSELSMEKKITVDEYFTFPETIRPMELVYGYVREPAMPFGDHQLVVVRLATLLDAHVRERNLGRVFPPMDVVLDRETGLVVQPDLLFISTHRMNIVPDRVWGAPDLVVEVASPSTEHRDRTLKLAWYRRYGVKECWLVYPRDRRLEVVDCQSGERLPFAGEERIRSKVLPEFDQTAGACFE
jgi:Uma2 family endonuclease